MLEAQNRRIDHLVERIRLQQEKLDKQNVRIRTLQSQVRKRYNYSHSLQTNRSASHIRVIVFFLLLFCHIFGNLISGS